MAFEITLVLLPREDLQCSTTFDIHHSAARLGFTFQHSIKVARLEIRNVWLEVAHQIRTAIAIDVFALLAATEQALLITGGAERQGVRIY